MGHIMTNFTHHEVGAFEAKNKLGTLLDWVEAGDEVIITRRGRAVARMVSATARHNRDDARRAADALLEITRSWRLDGLTVDALKTDGRR